MGSIKTTVRAGMAFLSLTSICILLTAINSSAQNVGVGISSPKARLHIADSNVVFSATGPNPPLKGNPPFSGEGRRMMWYADKGAFRTGYVQTMNWDKDSIGEYSFAAGWNPKAKGTSSVAIGGGTSAAGFYSVAMGLNSVALGQGSIALGDSTIASGHSSISLGGYNKSIGDWSIAMGDRTEARGQASTALGDRTIAKSFGSVAAGIMNDTADFSNGFSITPLDRIFQIGNGSSGTRSNAFTILRNASTGIGTATPLARLHVADSSVLFAATGDILFPVGNPPISGAGRRMMWYADYAAFRAGYVDATQWDKASIGRYSFATGYNAMANGDLGSTAMGFYPTASGVVSTALGNTTVASGHSSTAMGHSSIASGLSSTAMGLSTIANGERSTAMGDGTMARGYGSTSVGVGTRAKAYGSLSIGMNNDTTDNPNTTVSATSDRIFQIGNGDVTGNTRKNAMTVLRNGNVGIGQLNPIAPLGFNSSTGEKIVFFGDSEPNYGIGIQANVMQFHTPYPVTSMVFGTGSSNSFTEYVRINGIGQVGIGTSTPQAQLEVNGFTKLGSSSPKIQIKKLTGTTNSVQGGQSIIAHGLDASKIISITVLVEWSTNSFLHEGYKWSSGYEFNFYTDATSIYISTISGNSTNILSKPFKVLITYEE